MIRANKVSKCYKIYRRPWDHLKESLTFGRKQYHEQFWALRDVDLEVPRGCCLGIIGENGSGKSTLLRIIAGVVGPTSGAVTVDGRVSALLELGAGFNPEFTGRENVFLNAAILGFTDAETRTRMPSIEKFAEIGEFVDLPVKTYSTGMFVRLAFAVAIHMDPDILIIDEALSVGDFYFQQRCMRRIQQLKSQGVTIVFVSHDIQAQRSLADRAIWVDHGQVILEGPPDEVASRYTAAMITRGKKEMMGEEEIGQALSVSPDLVMTEEALSRMPPFLKSIANLDHRHGNGKARVKGIGVFGSEGYPVTRIGQGDRLSIRISVEFLEDVEKPNIGFMLRNRLGEDVTGSNVMFEGERLQPARAGDQLSVDFVMDLPLLQGGFYHFSPAVAEGTLDQYETCDWIENAFAVEVVQRTTTHGHMRIPIRVRPVNVKGETSPVS
jgi:lipopolysaccharide transport system ATP-binding protein